VIRSRLPLHAQRGEGAASSRREGVRVPRAMTDERPTRSSGSWSKRQLRIYPELAWFDRADPIARRCVGRTSMRANMQALAGSISAVVWALLCGVGVVLLGRVSDALGAIFFVTILIGTPIAYGFGAYWVYRSTQRLLRSELRRRGIPACLRCGYVGGDMSAPRCPECGAPASS